MLDQRDPARQTQSGAALHLFVRAAIACTGLVVVTPGQEEPRGNHPHKGKG